MAQADPFSNIFQRRLANPGNTDLAMILVDQLQPARIVPLLMFLITVGDYALFDVVIMTHRQAAEQQAKRLVVTAFNERSIFCVIALAELGGVFIEQLYAPGAAEMPRQHFLVTLTDPEFTAPTLENFTLQPDGTVVNDPILYDATTRLWWFVNLQPATPFMDAEFFYHGLTQFIQQGAVITPEVIDEDFANRSGIDVVMLFYLALGLYPDYRLKYLTICALGTQRVLVANRRSQLYGTVKVTAGFAFAYPTFLEVFVPTLLPLIVQIYPGGDFFVPVPAVMTPPVRVPAGVVPPEPTVVTPVDRTPAYFFTALWTGLLGLGEEMLVPAEHLTRQTAVLEQYPQGVRLQALVGPAAGLAVKTICKTVEGRRALLANYVNDPVTNWLDDYDTTRGVLPAVAKHNPEMWALMRHRSRGTVYTTAAVATPFDTFLKIIRDRTLAQLVNWAAVYDQLYGEYVAGELTAGDTSDRLAALVAEEAVPANRALPLLRALFQTPAGTPDPAGAVHALVALGDPADLDAWLVTALTRRWFVTAATLVDAGAVLTAPAAAAIIAGYTDIERGALADAVM